VKGRGDRTDFGKCMEKVKKAGIAPGKWKKSWRGPGESCNATGKKKYQTREKKNGPEANLGRKRCLETTPCWRGGPKKRKEHRGVCGISKVGVVGEKPHKPIFKTLGLRFTATEGQGAKELVGHNSEKVLSALKKESEGALGNEKGKKNKLPCAKTLPGRKAPPNGLRGHKGSFL